MFNAEVPTIDEYLPLEEELNILDDEDDNVPLGYTYDYGGKRVVYVEDDEIRMDPGENSLFHEL